MKITFKTRKSIEKYLNQGLSYREMSFMLGIPKSTIHYEVRSKYKNKAKYSAETCPTFM